MQNYFKGKKWSGGISCTGYPIAIYLISNKSLAVKFSMGWSRKIYHKEKNRLCLNKPFCVSSQRFYVVKRPKSHLIARKAEDFVPEIGNAL